MSHLENFHDAANSNLWRSLPQDQIDRVFATDAGCEIGPDFLGFVDIYQALTKIIPHYWTVVDLGCAYAPQCFYFENHAAYIGVDLISIDARFTARNTTHIRMTIAEYLSAHTCDVERTFAICSYVPPWHGDNQGLAKSAFKNVFTYYPSALTRQRPPG